ncbi:MAG TPA: hypothetical protein VGL27_04965 [Negativicutes bacterium]|jgi:hypothetical protein
MVKINLPYKNMLRLVLFLGISLGVVFGTVTQAYATPDLSKDGKTCTPCHTDGRTGDQ